MVRVAIVQEASSVRVTVLAPCRLTELGTGKLILERESLKWQQVETADPGLKIGGLQTEARGVLLEPTVDAIIR